MESYELRCNAVKVRKIASAVPALFVLEGRGCRSGFALIADRSVRVPYESHFFSALWFYFVIVETRRKGSLEHFTPKAGVVIGGPLREL